MFGCGKGYRFHVTGLTHDTSGFPTMKEDEITAMLEKLKNKEIRNTKDLTIVEEYLMDDARYCIFAYGSVARSARLAVKMLRSSGIRAGLMCPKIVWPFPKGPVEAMLERVKLVLVPEMNVGQIRKELERLCPGRRRKVRGLNVMNSKMISAEQIAVRVQQLRMRKQSYSGVASSE